MMENIRKQELSLRTEIATNMLMLANSHEECTYFTMCKGHFTTISDSLMFCRLHQYAFTASTWENKYNNYLQAMKPRWQPTALLKVPKHMSTSFSHSCNSGKPSPFSPRTSVAWAWKNFHINHIINMYGINAEITMNLYNLDIHHQWLTEIHASCEVQQVGLLDQKLHPY